MLYNNWNDPEIEMEEATVQDFIDYIDDEEMDDVTLHFVKDDLKGYNKCTIPLYEELISQYGLVDNEYTEDVFYDKLEERINKESEIRLMAIKAEVKKFLQTKGISKIANDKGEEVRLGNAKTVELLKAATKLGY